MPMCSNEPINQMIPTEYPPMMYSGYETNGKYLLNGGCPLCAYEDVDVEVPVTVRAYADVGNVTLKCMGSSIVTQNPCDTYCAPGASSNFTIRQRIRVDIPIVCNAECNVGEGQVYYDTPKENNTYYYNSNLTY